MIHNPKQAGFAKPPRPTKTLADIRRNSELCWWASLILIWEWMEATITGNRLRPRRRGQAGGRRAAL